jgi:hypothetical protein
MSEQTEVKKPRKARRPMTLAYKIRRALAQGMTPKEIAKKYRTDLNYINGIRWQDKRKQKEREQNLPPAGATVDFTFDASSQSFTQIVTPPVTPAPVTPPTSVNLPTNSSQQSGIVLLIDKKEAAPNPVAVEERKLSLWEKFKFWAFGIRV